MRKKQNQRLEITALGLLSFFLMAPTFNPEGSALRFPWTRTAPDFIKSPKSSYSFFDGDASSEARVAVPQEWEKLSTADLVQAVADTFKQNFVPTESLKPGQQPKMDETIVQGWLDKEENLPSGAVVSTYHFYENALDKHGTLIFRGKLTLQVDKSGEIKIQRFSTKKNTDQVPSNTNEDQREVVGTGEDEYSFAYGFTLDFKVLEAPQKTLYVKLTQHQTVERPVYAIALFESSVRSSVSGAVKDMLTDLLRLIENAPAQTQREPQSLRPRHRSFGHVHLKVRANR